MLIAFKWYTEYNQESCPDECNFHEGGEENLPGIQYTVKEFKPETGSGSCTLSQETLDTYTGALLSNNDNKFSEDCYILSEEDCTSDNCHLYQI